MYTLLFIFCTTAQMFYYFSIFKLLSFAFILLLILFFVLIAGGVNSKVIIPLYRETSLFTVH